MARRSYDQYCPAARALDVIGERWTMLVVRELLLGQKRYTDLLAGLPGIGPNVLAERMRHLQDSGLVRRQTLPPPAASTVYELTDLGEGLRPVVQALTRWGLNVLGPPKPGDRFQLSWLLRVLESTFRPDAARGVHETYEFRLDGQAFHVVVEDGTVALREGPARDPAFVSTSDVATFIAIGARAIDFAEAVETGRAVFEGDWEAGLRSIEILGPHLGSLAQPGGMLGALQARLRPESTRGVTESYEFRIDGEVFHVRVDDGTAAVGAGPAGDPALIVTADLGALLSLSIGDLDPESAAAAGRLRLEGSPEAAARAWEVVNISAGAQAW